MAAHILVVDDHLALRDALRIMLEHPLFGVGFNMDTLATVEKGGGWIDTHNAYLKVGAGLGIPGLVVYLLLIWHVFKAIREAAS